MKALYLSTLEYFALQRACIPIAKAFDGSVYLVGSCLTKPDFRDVDVRVMLEDDRFAQLFDVVSPLGLLVEGALGNALWSCICSSISADLSQQTGLRVDFQIQMRSIANIRYPGVRNALLEYEPCFAAGGDATSLPKGADITKPPPKPVTAPCPPTMVRG